MAEASCSIVVGCPTGGGGGRGGDGRGRGG